MTGVIAFCWYGLLCGGVYGWLLCGFGGLCVEMRGLDVVVWVSDVVWVLVSKGVGLGVVI